MSVEEGLTNEVVYGDFASLPKRLTQQLVRGADPNYQDKHGKTALYHLLHLARREENMKTNTTILQSMQILLEGGSSVDIPDITGQTIVHFAAAENMPSQILIPLLRKCNTNELSVAAVHDLMATDCLDVELLVAVCRSDVDLLSSRETNVTAMHRMVGKCRPTDARLVHTLASERSRDFDTIKDDLLFHACVHGSKETLQALLQLGASVAVRGNEFELPSLLLAASSATDEEAVEKVNVLVANGADLHMTSSNGQNLCHIAAILCHSKLLELAIAARVDHTYRDKEGSTPLHYACAAPGNGAVISLLIDAGLDVNELNSDGLTPLNLSIRSQNVDNISSLIKATVDITMSGLEDCQFHDLTILAQPEVIRASPKPLEYALILSSFYECMAKGQRRSKESYMSLSVELENAAIDMIEGLHSSQLQGLALHGSIIEMAISTSRKKFIATDAVQYELHRVWQDRQEPTYKALFVAFIKFFLQTLARPLVVFFVWPLIVFNIEVGGRRLSWDIIRPSAAPTVRYRVEAFAYVCFIILLFVEAYDLEFIKQDVTTLEWITLVYVLALLYNEFVSLVRLGFCFYFTRLGHKRSCLTIAVFIVFYMMRLIAIYGDNVKSRSTILRVSSYLLAWASTTACTRILQYLRVHQLIGPLHKSYQSVMVTLSYFLVILFIYLLAFASGLVNIYGATSFASNEADNCTAFHNVCTDNCTASHLGTVTDNCTASHLGTTDCSAEAFNSVFSTSVSLFWSLFGLLDLDKLKNCTSAEETVGKIVFGIWLIQAMILLLNMLIALITNKFDEVQSNADIEWKFSLAATILDVQKCQRFPVPFNLLYIFVDLLEWLFNKDNFMKRRFDLLPCLCHHTGERDATELEIDIFRQAEETKVLSQAATRRDVVEINDRLVKMEASLLSVCKSLNIQSKLESCVSQLDSLNRDSWGYYRKRLSKKISSSDEYTDELPKKETELRGRFKKSLMRRMLEKTDRNLGKSAATSPVLLGRSGNQLNPIVEAEIRANPVLNSDALTRALTSLEHAVHQQGHTLLQIQSQLANVDNRLKQLESKYSKPKGLLQFRFEEEAAV